MRKVILLALFIFFIQSSVFACSCIHQDMRTLYKDSTYISIVKVVGTKVLQQEGYPFIENQTISFTLDNTYNIKGASTLGLFKIDKKFDYSNQDSCGSPTPLKEEETYVIFNNNYHVYTGICDPNFQYWEENSDKINALFDLSKTKSKVTFFTKVRNYFFNLFFF